MPRFQYRVRTHQNTIREGVLEEKSWEHARAWLRHRFKLVVHLEEIRPPLRQRWWHRRVSSTTLAVFLRQFQVLLNAGIPMHRALLSLANSSDHPGLNAAIFLMYRRVENGWSLSQAMREHPNLFSPLHLGLIRTGEHAGRLVASIERIADHAERSTKLWHRFTTTMTYPLALAVVCVVLLALVVVFLIPRMEGILLSVGAEPPLITRIMLTAVKIGAHPLVWIGFPAVLGGGLFVLATLHKRKRWFRRRIDGAILRLPYLGALVRKMESAQLLSAWATLLEAGVPIGNETAVVGALARNETVRDAFLAAQFAMTQGDEVHKALAATRSFPSMVVQMVKVGEESGELEKLMRKVAEMYEEDVAEALNEAARLLEPAVLIFMGLVVGFVALATALPIVNLTSHL